MKTMKKHEVFEGLPEDVMHKLFYSMNIEEFNANYQILLPGTLSKNMLFLSRGELSVEVFADQAGMLIDVIKSPTLINFTNMFLSNLTNHLLFSAKTSCECMFLSVKKLKAIGLENNLLMKRIEDFERKTLIAIEMKNKGSIPLDYSHCHMDES